MVPLPSGEVRYGVNPPLEESDLSKMTPEEMKKKVWDDRGKGRGI